MPTQMIVHPHRIDGRYYLCRITESGQHELWAGFANHAERWIPIGIEDITAPEEATPFMHVEVIDLLLQGPQLHYLLEYWQEDIVVPRLVFGVRLGGICYLCSWIEEGASVSVFIGSLDAVSDSWKTVDGFQSLPVEAEAFADIGSCANFVSDYAMVFNPPWEWIGERLLVFALPASDEYALVMFTPNSELFVFVGWSWTYLGRPENLPPRAICVPNLEEAASHLRVFSFTRLPNQLRVVFGGQLTMEDIAIPEGVR